MMKKPVQKENNIKLLKKYPKISLIAVGIFLLLLSLLHFIEPDFEPSKHLISEYELGRFGILMSFAFFSLAVGVHTMVLSTWSFTNNKTSLIGRYFFLSTTIALFGVGIFYPSVIPNWVSITHTIFGVMVIFTFPVAATLYTIGFNNNQKWTGSRIPLLIATVLVWIGLLVFASSISAFQPETLKDKGILTIGWQNRLMILAYCLWIMIVAFKAKLIQDRNLSEVKNPKH